MSDYTTIPAEDGQVRDNGVFKRIISMIPDRVNLDIFDPNVSHSPRDRVMLIAEYCQSVSNQPEIVVNACN